MFLSRFWSGPLSPVGVGGEEAEVAWVPLGPQHVDREEASRWERVGVNRTHSGRPEPDAPLRSERRRHQAGGLGSKACRGCGGETRAA